MSFLFFRIGTAALTVDTLEISSLVMTTLIDDDDLTLDTLEMSFLLLRTLNR